jgi:hypothetical protein
MRELYAKSNLNQVDIARMTGISVARVGFGFDRAAETEDTMSFWVLLRVSAVLAPVHGGSIKDTMMYILEDNLKALDELCEAQKSGAPSS